MLGRFHAATPPGPRRSMHRWALAWALLGTACSDDVPPASPGEGGVPLRDAPLADVPGRPPAPDTIVPCRALGAARTLAQAGAAQSVTGAVAPGLPFDELLVAWTGGPSGPSQVTTETVRSDGVPYQDDAAATPEHPRVASPSLATTTTGSTLAYLHDGTPPLRPFAATRPAATGAWTTPVPLSPLPARRVRVAPAGAAAVAVFLAEADGATPARLHRAVIDGAGAITVAAAPLDGTDGTTAFALAARGSRVSLVHDAATAGEDGRSLLVRTLGADGEPVGAPVVVAVDRALTGQPAVLRAPPGPGESADVVLVAWTELDAGLSPDVRLARVGEGAFEDVITRNAEVGSDPALAPLLGEWFAVFYRDHGRDAVRARLGRPYRTGGLTADDVFDLGSPSGALEAAASLDDWSVGLTWTEQVAGGGFRVVQGTARCTDR